MKDIVHRNKKGNLEVDVDRLNVWFGLMLDNAMTAEEVNWLSETITGQLTFIHDIRIEEVEKYKWS